MNDDRVGGRNVETGFDDIGRQQHIVGPVVELGHHLLELACRQLAMGDGNAHLGHQLGQPVVKAG